MLKNILQSHSQNENSPKDKYRNLHLTEGEKFDKYVSLYATMSNEDLGNLLPILYEKVAHVIVQSKPLPPQEEMTARQKAYYKVSDRDYEIRTRERNLKSLLNLEEEAFLSVVASKLDEAGYHHFPSKSSAMNESELEANLFAMAKAWPTKIQSGTLQSYSNASKGSNQEKTTWLEAADDLRQGRRNENMGFNFIKWVDSYHELKVDFPSLIDVLSIENGRIINHSKPLPKPSQKQKVKHMYLPVIQNNSR